MKKIFTLFFVMLFINLIAQDRLGITIGATNYVTDTNYLFSKSGTGFTFGLFTSWDYNERSSLFLEMNYNEHYFKLIGRETELSTPEDLKFKLPEFSIPIIYNYNFLLLNDFKFGVLAGPSLHFIHDINIVDESKEQYFLEPFLTSPRYMKFDTENENISTNIFLAFGISAQYQDSLMANFRYYYGITDPYRRSPVYSKVVDISGKDSYFSFAVTYFFN